MAKCDVVVSGYGVIEAPTLDDGGGIIFSDVSRGGVYRLSPTGQVETVIPKRKGVGGICLHESGGFIVSGRDITYSKNGQTTILCAPADCPPPGPVAGFNDLCADHKGRILIGPTQIGSKNEKLAQNFLRVVAPHDVKVIYADVKGSNGVAVDAERKRIFHVATRAKEIIVSSWDDDDAVRIIHRISTADIEGIPDGLRIDVEGCIWVAFFEGGSVVRFSPAGKKLDVINPPSRMTTSLCFTGSDMKDMYIGTHDNTQHPELEGCLFRTRSPVAGQKPLRVKIAVQDAVA
jgi:sugar lactone lactonase YvrE